MDIWRVKDFSYQCSEIYVCMHACLTQRIIEMGNMFNGKIHYKICCILILCENASKIALDILDLSPQSHIRLIHRFVHWLYLSSRGMSPFKTGYLLKTNVQYKHLHCSLYSSEHVNRIE